MSNNLLSLSSSRQQFPKTLSVWLSCSHTLARVLHRYQGGPSLQVNSTRLCFHLSSLYMRFFFLSLKNQINLALGHNYHTTSYYFKCELLLSKVIFKILFSTMHGFKRYTSWSKISKTKYSSFLPLLRDITNIPYKAYATHLPLVFRPHDWPHHIPQM